MQSLHRGSFCVCRDGEKPRQESRCKPAEKLDEGRDTRRNAQRSPWNFSPYLRIVYHKAL